MWLCGLLLSGELFLWNRDKDLLKTATSVPEVVQVITSTQGMNFIQKHIVGREDYPTSENVNHGGVNQKNVCHVKNLFCLFLFFQFTV